ncbi:hypothetical protein IDH44_07770, partial [Paenibacillus sp. IB182496]
VWSAGAADGGGRGASGARCEARLGELPLQIRIAAAAFGAHEPRCEVTRVGDTVCADLVLYSGTERRIELAALGRAFVAGQLALGEPLLPTRAEQQGERYVVAEPAGAPGLRIAIPMSPGPAAALRAAADSQQAQRA